jgi:hypothetical protein
VEDLHGVYDSVSVLPGTIAAFRANKPHCGPGNPTTAPVYSVFVSVGRGDTEEAVLTQGISNEDGRHSHCSLQDLEDRVSDGGEGLALLNEVMTEQWVQDMLEHIETFVVPWDDIHKPNATCRYVIHRPSTAQLPNAYKRMIDEYGSDVGDSLLVDLIETLGVCTEGVETVEILKIRAGSERQDWHMDCVAGNVNYMIYLSARESTRVRR